MPGLPPNAWRERISDYINRCGGIIWRETKVVSIDKTELALCIASFESPVKSLESSSPSPVYILYLQGNVPSLPPHLPFLSPVLRTFRDDEIKSRSSGDQGHVQLSGIRTSVRYIIVCLSYRRPSESGIAKDANTALEWITSQPIDISTQHVPVILWDQSIGAGFAASLAASQELLPTSSC